MGYTPKPVQNSLLSGYIKMRSFTLILVIILFCVPVLCLARVPINVADQVKPTESRVEQRSIQSLDSEIRNTFPSKSASTQSNTSPRPWWIGDLITVLGILISVVIVIFQLGRQHRNNLKQQRENYREQFRLSIYQKFSKLINAAVQKQVASYSYASRILENVRTYHDGIKEGFPHSPLKERPEELSKLHYELIKAAIEVIFLI